MEKANMNQPAPGAPPPPYPGPQDSVMQPPGYSQPPAGPAGYPTAAYPQGPNPGPYYPQQPQACYPGVQTAVGGYATYHGGPTVVLQQPAMMATTVVQMYREMPVSTNCHSCHANIVTATQYEAGTFAWLICIILVLVGLGWGCCVIPFFVDGCKDVIHTCPNCRVQLYRWNRM